MNLIGTGCVNTHAMHVGRRFLETCPEKAPVQFLFENGKKSKLFVDYYSCSALRIAAIIVVISWVYLLSIHSCLLDFLLIEFHESWVTIWQAVCWKPSLLV